MVAEKNRVWRSFGYYRDHLLDVVDKAHVEHAIGFIEYEDRDMIETRVALIHQIEQATRRCDQNIEAALQRLDLWTLAHAAEDDRGAQGEMTAIGAETVVNLDRELAGWGEDECPHRATLQGQARRCQALQDRQGKGSGLAGAGLSDAEQIPAGEEVRDGLRLNRRRLDIVFRGDGALKRLDEIEFGKGKSHFFKLS